jgi:hypothetical protein
VPVAKGGVVGIITLDALVGQLPFLQDGCLVGVCLAAELVVGLLAVGRWSDCWLVR